jgi:hypothetical protein
MARPTKDPALVKDEILKIPLTTSQKELIVGAAVAAGKDTAAWAREMLVIAAERQKQAAKALKAHGSKLRR